MATNAKNLTLQVAAATYKDMITMVQKEREYRKALVNGVKRVSLFKYYFVANIKII
jgi:hypothetical protein